MDVNAFFTNYGVPATGLAPTIKIRRVSDGVLVVNGAAMTELGDGFYRYAFAAYDNIQTYVVVCDGGATLGDNDRYATAHIGEVGLTEQVKAKTDNLPADPASQSVVTGAITTAEENIRGADSDTLKTLSDHLDSVEGKENTIDTVVDAIKLKTDNLPNDPASQASVNASISTAEANIRGGTDTLGLLSDQLDGNLSAIQSIQNNTTRRIDIPARLIRPDAGSKTYRLILGIYDNTGMPEVPDSVPTVQIENIAGTERLAETVMTQYAGQNGQYYYDLVVTSADALEVLIVAIKVVEGGVTSYHRRATEVTEFESDLNEVQANVTAIKTKTDNLPANTAQELTDIDGAVAAAQLTLDDGVNGLAAIKTAVNTVDTVSDAIKERTDRLPDAPASEGNVNGVRVKTDCLPANTAQELTDIDSAIVNSESTITNLLSHASFGLAALKTLIDNVDTSAELADRFTEIKGAGWVNQTLVQLDGLLDVIKAKTDQLPVNTAQELTDIDTQIAGVRNKTDQLPVNTTQELLDIDTEIAGVRAKTDQLPVDTATELNAIDTEIAGVRLKTDQLPANTAQELVDIDTEIAGVRLKTDNLPVDTTLELNNIDTEIAATRERTDRLPDDTADQSMIQDALDAAETRLNADLDELLMRNGGQTMELGYIHEDLLLVKARTDYLPANLANSLDQIRNMISQISSGDGGVSAAEIQAMLDALNVDLIALLNAMQTDVTFIRDIEGGRWKIQGTQMVFFKEDNSTEVARFNLFNASGLDSATSVHERRRA